MDKRSGVSLDDKVNQTEAEFLCAHHLKLASAYFEAGAKAGGVMNQIAMQFSMHHPARTPAMDFIVAVDKAYEELES